MMTSASLTGSPGSAREVERTLADLREDRDTAWVPDIIDGADYARVAEAGANSAPARTSRPLSARTFGVPRPSGATLLAVDLPWLDRLLLHDAVAELAAMSDAALSPGVCGYRTGAWAGHSHRDEYARFTEMTDGLAESAHSVVIADVRSFFSSMTLESVALLLARTFGDAATVGLKALVRIWKLRGQHALPAGYADARLISNLVLHHVDRQLPVPFTRWVDDYRLFVSRAEDGPEVIELLDRSLRTLQLGLNEAKLSVRRGGASWKNGRLPLTSVYHPDREEPASTRAALRDVFASSAADPVARRRELRFALPRMACSGDAIAIPFALHGLRATPWEAPRLVAYLQGFLEDERVGPAVDALLESASREHKPWMLARLSPLACRLPITASTAARLEDLLTVETPPVSWAAALRILARQRPTSAVRAAAHSVHAPDPRAALAAAHDLGDRLSDVPSSDGEPCTAKALEALDEAPLPPASSSL